MKKIFLPSLAVLLAANFASAHGFATSNQQIVGNYLVEFEYDTQGSVLAGDYINYNFDILDPKTQRFVNFGHAFVRISKTGGNVVAVADILATESTGAGKPSARLGTVIADPGDYDLELFFFDGSDNQLVTAKYEFTVASKNIASKVVQGSAALPIIVTAVLALVAGFGLSNILQRYEKTAAK